MIYDKVKSAAYGEGGKWWKIYRTQR